ncbi:hypothetical protein [Terrabacter sp. C0L_2]|uniref:hypothetical protein n=1 Tax=Terrabacter sp. C0L_2 TaxID=3108389 RepID=UPI002ED1E3FA|nr:hypothetical protein U5C87_08025 [Terrabacter sp. C0L_2]
MATLQAPAPATVEPAGSTRVWQWLAPLTIIALSVATLGAVLAFQNRGFNLLDESYLWQLIADPDASKKAGDVYLFGFVLYPLQTLAGGDIYVYRILGLVLTIGTASLLGLEAVHFANRARGTAPPIGRLWGIAVVACMAAMSTLAFTYNNRILSYNSLTVLGLMVAALGMLLLTRGWFWRGAAVLGAGFWVTFAGKPTSALGLVALSLGVLAYVRPGSRRWLRVAAVATGAGVILALITIRMSPSEAIGYLERGVARARLRGNASPWMLLGWGTQDWSALSILGPATAAAAIAGFALMRRASPPRAAGVLTLLVPVVLALSFVDFGVFARSLAAANSGDRMRSLALLIPLLGVAFVVIGSWRRTEGAARRDSRRAVALAAALSLMPYVYALGSSTPFSLVVSHAALFWVAAITVLAADPELRSAMQVLVLVSASITVVLVGSSFVDGARGESLLAATQQASVNGSALLVTPTDQGVLHRLESVRLEHGLNADVPVVDLTGIAPGYALQLGGRPLGGGFFMGIFDGAPEAAAYGLSWEDCSDLAEAWLLYAADNTADVSRGFTRGRVDLKRDYDRVATFHPTQGPAEWRTLDIQVLRPRDSVRAALGCS